MATTVLRRIDQARNMARFYELDVQPGLFGDISVTRHWGRIGSNGQSKQHWFSDDTAASALSTKLKRQKEKRGYVTTGPSPQKGISSSKSNCAPDLLFPFVLLSVVAALP